MEISDHLMGLLRNLYAGQQATVITGHGTMPGSKLRKEYAKAVSCKMPDWMKHKLESRFLGEISVTSDMKMIPPLWQ